MKIIVISMPLPKAIDTPQSYTQWTGLHDVNKRLKDEDIPKIEKEFPDLSYVGTGGYGVAYNPNNNSNTIVKITTDASEILAAEKLMGNPLPCIVKVFSAKELNEKVWQIIVERLQPLTPTEHHYVDLLHSHVNRVRGIADWDWVGPSIQLRTAYVDMDIMEEIHARYKKMIDCLIQNRYRAIDTKADNIGKRQGSEEFVLLDLGGISN